MAYELVEEVFDHAPPMSPTERVILVCIAEKSRLPGRDAQISGEVLARRIGGEVGERGIRQALTRLAERGFEVRVPIAYDKRGEPLYAVPGRVRHFRVPHFRPAPADCACFGCRTVDRSGFPSSPKAASPFPLVSVEAPKGELQCRQAELQFPLGGTTVPPGGTTVPPLPSVETVPSQDPDSSAGDATDPAALARAEIRARISEAVRKRAA